jgi:acetylornithine deacetylase
MPDGRFQLDPQRPLDIAAALVAINSVNPCLCSHAPGEAEVAQYVAYVLRNAGLQVEIDEAAPGRPNVIGRLPGSGGGRSLLLNGHIDTVGVDAMEIEPFKPIVRDGRLYGRGALDMKGGLACILAAAETLALGGPLKGELIVAATVDEEYASVGMERLAGRLRADGGIITEPTNLRLVVAHKGFSWIEVQTLGRAAHGSDPDRGIDAIAAMGQVLGELERLQRLRYPAMRHPLLGTPTIHASIIEGGRELSTYPDECRLHIERRNLPHESEADVQAEMDELLARLARRDLNFRGSARVFLHRSGAELPADAPIAACLGRHLAARTGRTPEPAGMSPWLEAGMLCEAGTPTVLFGPAGEAPHAAVEYVQIESLPVCAQVLVDTAREFCGERETEGPAVRGERSEQAAEQRSGE